MKTIIVFAGIILLTIPGLFSQDIEGLSNPVRVNLKSAKQNDPGNEEITKSGKYYALLIGVQDYEDPQINDLSEPLQDVQDLDDILVKHYTFEAENITILKNPTMEELIVTLDHLSTVVKEDDNLLIFYAGHGFYNERTNQGFWLPSDAQKKNTARWFRNSTLVDYIRAIPSRHTLLVSDACFSGSIFKTRAAFNNASLAYYKLNKLVSRKGMTSGTLNEVPDHSVFMKYMKERLTENENKYMTSEELFSSFKVAVMNNSPNVPRFGEIQNVGDEGGDFIFIKR